MALAKYFDKNGLAASQVLNGYDKQAFEKRLTNAPVEIAFDGDAVTSKECINALDMLIRLLSRMYPVIKLTALFGSAEKEVQWLSDLALSINDRIELITEGDVVATVVVGRTPVERENQVLYIGSSGWYAKFARTSPVGCSNTNNPFGAGYSACLAAANVFRLVFTDQIANGQLDNDLCISLLDLGHHEISENEANDLPMITLPETFLVGLGAIGNGTVWALSKVRMEGKLHLIDPENLDDSNLQRYLLTTLADVGRRKSDLAVEQFPDPHLVDGHFGDWASFLNKRANWDLPFTLVAVDSAKDRIAVQSSLPEKVLNAWTQPTDLGISRHFAFGDLPCLSCIYPAKKTVRSESELIAGSLGLPQYERELRDMIYNNAPVSQDLISQISTAKSIPTGELQSFVGLPIREFYHNVICGGMITVTEGDRNTETPMAFQSAMAGILLAAEAVIHALHLRTGHIAVMTRINLLQPLSGYYSDPLARNVSTNCICNDQDFLECYAEKYPNDF